MRRSPSAGTAVADEPLLSLEGVSKYYPPPPPMRLRRFFARFRGLHVEDGFGPEALTGGELDDDDMTEEEPAEADLPPQRELTGRHVVDGVTLLAHGGSVIAVVGPAGAGKTVLLKLVGGLVLPTGGRVVVRGSVVPALNVMSLMLPAMGHTVRTALPQLGAIVGVSPRVVRRRLDTIADLMASPDLLKSSTSLMESRRKRELILAMALAVEPDILLLDMPIRQDAFGDRCMLRIDALRERGTLIMVEMPGLRRKKERLEPDRVVTLDQGRLLSDLPRDAAPAAP